MLNADKTDCEGMIIFTFWLKGDECISFLNEMKLIQRLLRSLWGWERQTVSENLQTRRTFTLAPDKSKKCYLGTHQTILWLRNISKLLIKVSHGVVHQKYHIAIFQPVMKSFSASFNHALFNNTKVTKF